MIRDEKSEDYPQIQVGSFIDESKIARAETEEVKKVNADVKITYKVYSSDSIGKPELNRGNKIILPTSDMERLFKMGIEPPMTFMISSDKKGIESYCGVLDFLAKEGKCHIPNWMMRKLCVKKGSMVNLRNINLKKCTYVKFKPHETAEIELSSVDFIKFLIKRELNHYSVL